MPQPVSDTSTRARPESSRPVRTRTSWCSGFPSGMACRALTSRLSITCPSRASLPMHLRGLAEVLHQPRPGAHRMGRHAQRGHHHLVDIQHRPLLPLLPAEHLQIAHDDADALGALAGTLQAGLRLGEPLGPAGQTLPHALQVQHQVGERVVDLMTDSGGQRAHRGDALGGHQLRLELLLRGDVAVGGHEVRQLSVPVAHRRQLHLAVHPRAVLVEQHHLPAEEAAVAQRRLQPLQLLRLHAHHAAPAARGPPAPPAAGPPSRGRTRWRTPPGPPPPAAAR